MKKYHGVFVFCLSKIYIDILFNNLFLRMFIATHLSHSIRLSFNKKAFGI